MNEKVRCKKRIPLLEVKDFSLHFRHYEKGLREVELEVIHKFNVTVYQGEIVAIVGASGSGKSLLADAILGILPKNAYMSGTLNYQGEALTEERQHALRGKEISLIPQSVNALNPLMKAGKQVQTGVKSKDKRAIQQALFRKVSLPKVAEQQYPFELSGGMQRRVLAATALGSKAKLIIADEPTPGLDPKSLAETISQLKQLVTSEKGMMFITHDIEAALQIADKVFVFCDGETVEVASVSQFSGKGEQLQHDYTKALWNALPQNSFAAPTLSPGVHVRERQDKTDAILKTKYTSGRLEVKGISYHYPQSPSLFEGVNLTIKRGEILGVYGNSGSGKSTMAKIISGYKEQTVGKVCINGEPIKSLPHPVQLVWQHPEKVINPRWRMRKMLQEVDGLSLDFMASLGIKEEWLSRWPSEISSGELQRFCLARALASDVHYLIADEITTMLDAVTQAQIWSTLLQVVKNRNIGVLAFSHNHHLLQKVSDRVINFEDLR